jgi:hypothetical protein
MLRRSAWRREWQWDCSLPGFEMFEVFQAGIWPPRRKSMSTPGQRVRTRPSSCGPKRAVRVGGDRSRRGCVVGGGVVENVARMVQSEAWRRCNSM